MKLGAFDRRGGPILLALVLAGLTASLVLAASPGTWTQALNLSDIPGRSTQASLTRNPLTGDLFVVWADKGIAPNAEILGRQGDQTGQSWQPDLGVAPENLSQSEWEDGGPMVFFDHQGHGLLLWTRRYSAANGAAADGTDLLWRSWQGTSWSAEAVLVHADTYLPGTYGLIPIETPSTILLFITFDQGYRTAEYQNGQWSAISPWSYLDVALAQIIRDNDGLLHAAGYGPNSSQLGWDEYFLDAYYLTFDGVSWSQALNLSSTNGVAESVGLAFDAQGHLHFLWSDSGSIYSSETLRSAIWERVHDGSGWSPNTEISVYNPDQGISGLSLASDVSGTLHLAWSEGILINNALTSPEIDYRAGDGVIWAPEEKVYTSTGESRYPVLRADSDGAFLVWHEGPLSDRDVYFSRQVLNGSCQGLANVTISGAKTGVAGHFNTFGATSSPQTATAPITYTWQASGQSPVVHRNGLMDTTSYTWTLTGTEVVTVTVENCGGQAADTHSILIREQPYQSLYLPLIAKDYGP